MKAPQEAISIRTESCINSILAFAQNNFRHKRKAPRPRTCLQPQGQKHSQAGVTFLLSHPLFLPPLPTSGNQGSSHYQIRTQAMESGKQRLPAGRANQDRWAKTESPRDPGSDRRYKTGLGTSSGGREGPKDD